MPVERNKKRKSIYTLGACAIVAALSAVYFQHTTELTAPTAVYEEPKIKTAITAQLPQSPPFEEVRIMAVGDIMLSRSVGRKMIEYSDYTYPFSETAPKLTSADITFGNLETAITPGEPVPTGSTMFRADKESLEGLKLGGFDIVSLANNHTPNYKEKGLRDTFRFLEEAGIAYIGAGADAQEAHRAVTFTKKGMTFGFLAYNDTDVVPPYYGAGEKRAGTAFMDIPRMEEDVRALKQNVDFVIVSMHSGTEYTHLPNERQKKFAHAAINAGAKLVIGHHPHWIQPLEKYNNGYILYSLGNFVFDQMWSEETRHGVVADVVFTQRGVKTIEFYPVIIEDYAQPRFIEQTDELYQSILDMMRQRAQN